MPNISYMDRYYQEKERADKAEERVKLLESAADALPPRVWLEAVLKSANASDDIKKIALDAFDAAESEKSESRSDT